MDATADPMISVERVAKRFADGTVAVHELTLAVGPGEVCVLVGPSGCGKTTTMRMINRLVDPSSGRILVGGEDITRVDPVQLRRQIGYVIQQVGLFPHLTVRRNVATVPQLLGWDRARTAGRVDDLLELVGLDPASHGDRYPHQLSGGQRQRVGVARALAADPPVLLMDEPFGAVDPIARERLQEQFALLQQQLHKTVVFVTHDIDEAVRLGDRIAVMRDGGHLEQYADPATVLARPVSDFVANFVGADRVLKLLAVTRITSQMLQPAGREDATDAGHLTLPADASLRRAVAALLDSPTGRITVAGDTGAAGVLTLEGVRVALARASAARDEDTG